MLGFVAYIILSVLNFCYYLLHAWCEKLCCVKFRFGYFSFTALCAMNASVYFYCILAFYSHVLVVINHDVSLFLWSATIIISICVVRAAFGLCKTLNQTLSLCATPFHIVCALLLSVFVTFSSQAVYTGFHGNDDKCEHPYPHFDNDPTTCFVFYHPLFTSVILAVLLIIQAIIYCVLICSGGFKRQEGGGWRRIPCR